jgi:3-hydroxyacyl-[acyl-carrier-protein] dehydratase
MSGLSPPLWPALVATAGPRPGAAAAELQVPRDLELFASHFPLRPVVPGVLILHSLVELAAEHLRRARGRSFRLGGMDAVRFRRFVEPGELLRLEVEEIETATADPLLSGRALVEGRLATTVRTIRMVARDQP